MSFVGEEILNCFFKHDLSYFFFRKFSYVVDILFLFYYASQYLSYFSSFFFTIDTTFWVVSLYLFSYGVTNCGPTGQLRVFVSKVLLEHNHIYVFIHILFTYWLWLLSYCKGSFCNKNCMPAKLKNLLLALCRKCLQVSFLVH